MWFVFFVFYKCRQHIWLFNIPVALAHSHAHFSPKPKEETGCKDSAWKVAERIATAIRFPTTTHRWSCSPDWGASLIEAPLSWSFSPLLHRKMTVLFLFHWSNSQLITGELTQVNFAVRVLHSILENFYPLLIHLTGLSDAAQSCWFYFLGVLQIWLLSSV